MVDPLTAFFGGMTVALLGSAALLLYPAYAYAGNVLYSRGVKILATSLLALAVGWSLGYVEAYGYVQGSWVGLVAQFLFTLSSALFLWANWEFAKDFVVLEEQDLPGDLWPEEDVQGGFERTIRDGSGEGER